MNYGATKDIVSNVTSQHHGQPNHNAEHRMYVARATENRSYTDGYALPVSAAIISSSVHVALFYF